MAYQFKRETLTQDEATRLANACATHDEKVVVWTLLDTGLRVSELATLTKDNLDLQMHKADDLRKGWAIWHKVKTPDRSANSSIPTFDRRPPCLA